MIWQPIQYMLQGKYYSYETIFPFSIKENESMKLFRQNQLMQDEFNSDNIVNTEPESNLDDQEDRTFNDTDRGETQNVRINQIDPETETRRSTRVSRPPVWHQDYIVSSKCSTTHPIDMVLCYDELHAQYKCFISEISKTTEPETYNEVVKDRNWKLAMQEEIKSLEENHTWSLVQLPKGKKGNIL